LPEPAGSSLKQTRSPTSSVLDCSGVIPLRFRYRTGRNVRGALPNFGAKAAWRMAQNPTAAPATQCRSNPVSGRGLPKTGIFQISAGDYQRFRSHSGRFWSPETDSRFAKARHWRAFLALLKAKSPAAGLLGWGRTIRTSKWRIGNRMLSPVQEEPQNLFSWEFISPSKRWNFENRTESAESRALEINGPFGE
jgi:hypothetical protein